MLYAFKIRLSFININYSLVSINISWYFLSPLLRNKSVKLSPFAGNNRCYTIAYWVRYLTFFFHQVLISWMVTLSSYLIWQIISFILPLSEYDCVYAWTTLGNIATFFENHGNVADCVWKLRRRRREAP